MSNDSCEVKDLNDSLEKANELRETINNAIDEEINRAKFEWLQKHVDCSKINEVRTKHESQSRKCMSLFRPLYSIP